MSGKSKLIGNKCQELNTRLKHGSEAYTGVLHTDTSCFLFRVIVFKFSGGFIRLFATHYIRSER